MKKIILPVIGAIALISTAFLACKKAESSSTTTVALPDIYKKFNSTLQVYVEGNYVVIKTNAVPDHKSPYFATTDSRYQAYNGSNPNFMLNPNRIIEQTLTFKVPLYPAEVTTKQSTPLGPIGVSLNG